jgi:ribose 5-phosphate isomerase RpiB
MDSMKDIEIALRDGMIAELTENMQHNIAMLSKAYTHVRLAEEMIDRWRDTAYEYRQLAMETIKAYDEQSLEMERIRDGRL